MRRARPTFPPTLSGHEARSCPPLENQCEKTDRSLVFRRRTLPERFVLDHVSLQEIKGDGPNDSRDLATFDELTLTTRQSSSAYRCIPCHQIWLHLGTGQCRWLLQSQHHNRSFYTRLDLRIPLIDDSSQCCATNGHAYEEDFLCA